MSYVEAVRRFPAGPDDKGCGLITWVRGWVIERVGQDPDIHVTARVTYCDREGVSFMLPLGQLDAGRRVMLGVPRCRAGATRFILSLATCAQTKSGRSCWWRAGIVRVGDARAAAARRHRAALPSRSRSAPPTAFTRRPRFSQAICPHSRVRGRAAPFDAEPVENLRQLNPSWVIIGDSMAGSRIDVPLFTAPHIAAGRAVVVCAGSGSAWWYLALKNWVIPSAIHPRAVFVFFRDTNLTTT